MEDVSQAGARLRALIDQRAEAIARRIVDDALRNHVSGGQVPYCVRVVSPTASTTAEVFRHTVTQKAQLVHCRVGGDSAVGTITADVRYIMPGADPSTAVSLFGINPPSGSGESTVVNPSPDWVRDLLPGMLLEYYVTAISGHGEAEVELVVRALGNG